MSDKVWMYRKLCTAHAQLARLLTVRCSKRLLSVEAWSFFRLREGLKRTDTMEVNALRGACLTGVSAQSTPWPEECKSPSVWRAACGWSSREWTRPQQCCEETQSDQESAAWVLSLCPSNTHPQTSRCTFHISHPQQIHFVHMLKVYNVGLKRINKQE